MKKSDFFKMKPGTLMFDTMDRPYIVVNMMRGNNLTLLRLSDGNLQTVYNDKISRGHLFVKEVCKSHQDVVPSLQETGKQEAK